MIFLLFISYGKPNPNITPIVQSLIDELECREVVLRIDFDMQKRRKIMPWIGIVTAEKEKIFDELNSGKISFGYALAKLYEMLLAYYEQANELE